MNSKLDYYRDTAINKIDNAAFSNPVNLGMKILADAGFDAAVSGIQDGTIPLKEIARPIEELNTEKCFVLVFGKNGAQASWIEDLDFDRSYHISQGDTHFLPLGGE